MQSILSLGNNLPVEMCVQTSQSDSFQRILIHTLHSTLWSPRKHQVDCNTIFQGRVSKLSSKCFHQNSVPDTRFEAEVPPSHIRSSMDIHVFWRSPWTGTKCITSSAVSPSCLTILKSDERETVNVAAKNDNTSQSDRWPIVSCWSYASTRPILVVSSFIRLPSCFYVASGISQLPNHDWCQWVFCWYRCHIIWWCHHDEFFSGSSRNYRMSRWKTISWKMWYGNFTNFPGHICQCIIKMQRYFR